MQLASYENGCELPASTNQHSFQRNASQHEGMISVFGEAILIILIGVALSIVSISVNLEIPTRLHEF